MSILSKTIIGKIKKGQVKPTPKWVFLFKRSFVWGLFVTSVLFGSIAIGIIFFQIRDAGWEIYNQMKDGWAEFILLALPYFWLLLMVLFLALAYYHFRHTKTGYRYNVFAIIGLSLVVSLVFGSVLYATGFSGRLEAFFQEIPHYEKLHIGKRMLWQRPEKGFLSGTIIQVTEGEILILQDFQEHAWWVDITRARIHPEVILQEAEKIKMLGKPEEGGYFIAEMISPWRRITPPPFPPPIRMRLK